jgi:DNA-binding MarR family transcriptional regulator
MKDSQESRFGLYISIINRAAQGYFYRKLKEYDVGPGQQAYLLSLFPGETIVQDELANRLKVDKANVTRALRGLEQSEYITRVRSSIDKRAWNITLTAAGIRRRAEIQSIAKDWIDTLKKPLSDEEWNHLEDFMQRIADSLRKP